MTEKIKEYKIITPREVEIERKRLLDVVPNKKDFREWLEGRKYPLRWMKKQFGETLIEKDGLTHASGDRFNDCDCNICGHKTDPDEKIAHLIFSFCNEYSCGMHICKKCLKELSNKLK